MTTTSSHGNRFRALIGATLAALFLIATIPSAPAQPPIYSSPSGEYLHLSTRSVMIFDATTGNLIPSGQSIYTFHCDHGGSPGEVEQCGDCGYVPPGVPWQSSSAQYTHGRCASIDIRDPTRLTIRIDVRVAHPFAPATDYNVETVVLYENLDGSTIADGVRIPKAAYNCANDDPVSYCQSDLFVWDAIAKGPAAPYAAICAHVRIMNSTAPFTAPELESIACTI